MRSGPATAAVPGVTADLRVTPALSGRLLSPWSYEGVPGGRRVPSWGPAVRPSVPLEDSPAHPACPDRGGGIGSRGTGPPCLRGNRTASCPMCMDRRRLTALVFSGRLFNPRCMAALWRGFIHLGGDALHSLFGSIHSALSRRRTGVRLCSCLLSCAGSSRRGASAARTSARRRRRGCARIGTRLRRASAGTAAFPTFISNGISGGFCDGASDPLDNRISHQCLEARGRAHRR